MSASEDEQETVVAQTKAEVRSQAGPLLKAMSALIAFIIIDAATEKTIRILEHYVFHKDLPDFVHWLPFVACAIIVVFYTAQQFILHCTKMVVDTILGVRQELKRLEKNPKKDKNI